MLGTALEFGVEVEREVGFGALEDICRSNVLTAAHEDVQVDVGSGEWVCVRGYDLALHETAHRGVHPVVVALKSELEVVLSLLPVLDAMAQTIEILYFRSD